MSAAIPASSSKGFRRRTDVEPRQAGDYYDSTKRYYDQNFEVTVVKIFSGEFYVSCEPGEMIVTILGSCVAACIRDPHLGIGGMNHFLLPGCERTLMNVDLDKANRYGACAMENLINSILSQGGRRDRLEVKLFGGGNVTASTAMIGDQNALFAHQYAHEEGFKIVSEDLGGTLPRRIHYFPDTGRVMCRRLKRQEDMIIVNEEQAYADSLTTQKTEGDVELF